MQYNQQKPTTEEPKKKRSKKLPVFVSEEVVEQILINQISIISALDGLRIVKGDGAFLNERIKETNKILEKIEVDRKREDIQEKEDPIKKQMKGEVDKGYDN